MPTYDSKEEAREAAAKFVQPTMICKLMTTSWFTRKQAEKTKDVRVMFTDGKQRFYKKIHTGKYFVSAPNDLTALEKDRAEMEFEKVIAKAERIKKQWEKGVKKDGKQAEKTQKKILKFKQKAAS